MAGGQDQDQDQQHTIMPDIRRKARRRPNSSTMQAATTLPTRKVDSPTSHIGSD